MARNIGGLDIGDIKDTNLAQLAMWRWRFKTQPQHMWVSVIKAIHSSLRRFKEIPMNDNILVT